MKKFNKQARLVVPVGRVSKFERQITNLKMLKDFNIDVNNLKYFKQQSEKTDYLLD